MKRYIFFSFLITMLFITSGNIKIYAQLINSFELISIKDGLSHNEIWNFEQDKYGYMWIATADGLNKYDGYNFVVYKNDPTDPASLASNKVSNVLEDKDGVLWIATNSGLSKFNRENESFKNYRFVNSSREDVNSIFSLFEDSKGIFWLSTKDGIRSFDRKDETFKSYEVLRNDNVVANLTSTAYQFLEVSPGEFYSSSIAYGLVKFDYENNLFIQLKLNDNFQSKLKSSFVLSLQNDVNGNIWYATRLGLFKIDPKNLTGEVIKNSITGKNYPFTSGLFLAKNNKMWIGTWLEGLYEYDLSTKKSIELTSKYRGYFSFYVDKTNILWTSSFGGILKYNFNQTPFELKNFEASSNQEKPIPLALAPSSKYKNLIWIGTTKGLYKYDKESKTLDNVSAVIPKITNGNQLNIEDVLESKKGNLYLATTNNGLYSHNLSSGKIKEYKPINYDNTSLRFNDVNTLLEDSENRIWVGQEDGLSILNKDQETFTRIPNFDFRQYSEDIIYYIHKLRGSRTPLLQIINVGDFADLSKEFVLSEDTSVLLSCIGEGNRGLGMYDYGLLESLEGDTLWSMRQVENTFNASGALKNRREIKTLQLKKGRYRLIYKTDDSHSADSFNQIPPQDSLYWGVELYSITENEFEKYQTVLDKNNNASYMNGKNVMSIFESSDKMIWAATMDGLSIIDPKTYSVKNINNDTSNVISISSNFVEDICEDNFGNIWIATQDGLNKYDRQKNVITVYHEKEGLPSNNLRALEIDSEGNLWVSSIKGISKVEISESTEIPIIINYDVRDGLQGYSFIGNASMKDAEGKLYFSGINGFNAFRAGVTDKSLSKIVLNKLSVSNMKSDDMDESILYSKDLNSLKEIDLSYDQNDISFEFASIHFARPDKNRLQYKMEGVDEVWHNGEKQIATYANLNPGDYIFKVRGSNGDGIWIDKPHEIKVSVTPAWWANIYAYFSYGVIFFGFLFGVRKFEMERRSRLNEYKQSELRAEAAELRAKAAEAERKLLEAENVRKSEELEEARNLQLSMLPKSLPQLPNLDIAVYMKTATEVGGDYYDFHVGMDGVLTVVLGDATGHGMKAGTMVTTTKSLFNVLAPNPNIIETFHEMTRCLKLMHLEKLAMCMSMLKISGNKVKMSSAGMPPIFIYKNDERVIEEHVIKGMPLGTMANFPYALKESEINNGDTILIMSDGFPELLNDEKEAFGYKRVRNIFEENSAETPEEIVRILKLEGDSWTNNQEPDDDITFVVIKVK